MVCFDDTDADKLDCPVLRVSPFAWQSLPWLLRKFFSAWRRLAKTPVLYLSVSESERLAAFFKEHNVKAVLAEYGKTACIVQHACRSAGARLFVHFHGADASRDLKDWRIRRAYRRLGRNVAGIITPSRFLADKLVAIGMPAEKTHIIPCGVDPDEFKPGGEPDPNLILAVGRFVEKKAPHHTIVAFAKIAAKHPGARLEMIGDGALFETCRQLVEQAGLQERITLHGECAHEVVHRKMAQAAVFVQHSVTAANGDTEGLGVSILEAMSSGLPVVSTRHNGIPEAVVDGETGLLVDEHDVEGMSLALDRLLGDAQLCADMGAAGRARVIERFSAEKTIGELRQLLINVPHE